MTAVQARASQDAGRVAVLIPHLRTGGGELSMLRLAAGLARGGLKVDLLVHTLQQAELVVPAELGVVELDRNGRLGSLGSVRVLANWLRGPQQRRPHWLLSAFPHTNVAAVAARAWARSDCRCVISEHAPLSLQIQRQGNLRYRVLPPLVRWAYPRADAVVAVSQGVRDDLQRLVGPGLRLHTIANPVLDDETAWPAGATSAAPDGGDGGDAGTPLHPWLKDQRLQVVLSVSRLSEEKDIPTLLRAFLQVHGQRPQARLLLAGEGPARSMLQRLVAELGLDEVVALPGRISKPRAWMQAATVFALASQYEGFGNVLIEALASGTPVVSTDCPVGPREILDGGRFGSLVPVADPAAMARALMQALDHPALPAGARAHAARFTDTAACTAWRQLLDGLRGPQSRHHVGPNALSAPGGERPG